MSSSKPTALFMSAHLPSMQVPQAGQKIAYETLKKQSQEYNVILITFVNNVEKDYVDVSELTFCKEVYFFHISNFSKIIRILRYPLLPIKMAVRYDKDVIKIIKSLMKKECIKQFHAEYTGVGHYVKLFDDLTYKTITEHDVVFQSYNRLRKNSIFKSILYAYEYFRQKKFELSMLKLFDKIFVLNEKDRLFLEENRIEHVVVQLPKLQDWVKKIKRTKDKTEKNTLLFWGAMNRFENQDAIKYFLNHILPLVEREVEIQKVFVVGANPSNEIVALGNEKIEVTGFVDNPTEFFEKANLGIVPLRYGAGIKIKTMEMLGSGLPTVATEIGGEGVPGNDLLFIEKNDELFATRIVQLLKDKISYE